MQHRRHRHANEVPHAPARERTGEGVPELLFLVPDGQSLCDSCRTGARDVPDRRLAATSSSTGPPPSWRPAAAAGRAAERPAGIGGRAVSYRDPARPGARSLDRGAGRRRRLTGLGAWRRGGPPRLRCLAWPADPPPVVVPSAWDAVTSTEGRFSAELPVGAVERSEPVDLRTWPVARTGPRSSSATGRHRGAVDRPAVTRRARRRGVRPARRPVPPRGGAGRRDGPARRARRRRAGEGLRGRRTGERASRIRFLLAGGGSTCLPPTAPTSTPGSWTRRTPA